MKEMQRAGSLKELQEGKSLDVMLNGQKIAIFYIDDEVIATSGKCPHAGGPIQRGDLAGALVTCPWHGWTFDLHSGVCTDDPCLALDVYQVKVEGDDILVAL